MQIMNTLTVVSSSLWSRCELCVWVDCETSDLGESKTRFLNWSQILVGLYNIFIGSDEVERCMAIGMCGFEKPGAKSRFFGLLTDSKNEGLAKLKRHPSSLVTEVDSNIKQLEDTRFFPGI